MMARKAVAVMRSVPGLPADFGPRVDLGLPAEQISAQFRRLAGGNPYPDGCSLPPCPTWPPMAVGWRI